MKNFRHCLRRTITWRRASRQKKSKRRSTTSTRFETWCTSAFMSEEATKHRPTSSASSSPMWGIFSPRLWLSSSTTPTTNLHTSSAFLDPTTSSTSTSLRQPRSARNTSTADSSASAPRRNTSLCNCPSSPWMPCWKSSCHSRAALADCQLESASSLCLSSVTTFDGPPSLLSAGKALIRQADLVGYYLFDHHCRQVTTGPMYDNRTACGQCEKTIKIRSNISNCTHTLLMILLSCFSVVEWINKILK